MGALEARKDFGWDDTIWRHRGCDDNTNGSFFCKRFTVGF